MSDALPFDPLLREHDRFVRNLARRLLADPAAADDVAQDAWVVALGRSRPDGVAFGAWLAGIAKQLVRGRRRDAARARVRGFDVAHDVPAHADDLVARTEIEQRLLSRVLELPEPRRSIVLLRFREDATSVAIGERLRLPDATVRWHLKRAIDDLRAHLDRDSFDWRAALLPLAAPVPLGGPAVAAAFGVSLMVSKFLLAAAAVVVATIGFAFLSSQRISDESSSPAIAHATPPVPPTMDETAPDAATRHAATLDTSPSPIDPPDLVVTGRCVDETGKPLVAVDVAWESFDRRSPIRERGAVSGFLATRGDGSFEIVVKKLTAGTRELILSFSRDDLSPASLATFEPVDGRVVLGDIELRGAGCIIGTVVDDLQRPVAGATVYASTIARLPEFFHEQGDLSDGAGRTATDAAGRFRLTGVPTGFVRVVASSPEHFFGASDSLIVTPGLQPQEARVVIERLGDRVIEGQCRDAAGNPLARARIDHEFEIGRNGLFTYVDCDDEGRFRVRAFEDVPHRFELRHDGNVVESGPVARGTRDLLLQVAARPTFQVRVRDAVSGTSITEFGASVHSDAFSHTTPIGEFAGGVANLPRPEAEFVVSIRGRGYLESNLGPFDPSAVPGEIVADLRAAPRIRGIVHRGGVPVAGALVTLYDGRNPMELEGFPMRSLRNHEKSARTSTDDAGRFELRVADADPTVYVRAEAADCAVAELGPFAWPTGSIPDPLVFELGDGGAIDGEVHVAAGRSAVGVLVRASRGDGEIVTTRTDERGHYRFEHLTPGPFEVRATRDEPQPQGSGSAFGLAPDAKIPSNCVVTAGAVTRLDLDLPEIAASAVSGIALADGGRPGVVVMLRRCDPDFSLGAFTNVAWEGFDPPAGDVLVAARVEPNGRYRLPAPAPGRYVVSLHDETVASNAESRVDAVVVLGAGEHTCDLAVRYGRVEGKVSNPVPDHPRGHEGTRVAFRARRGDEIVASGHVYCQRDGSFAFDSVPAGEVEVRGGGLAETITVRPNETARIAGVAR